MLSREYQWPLQSRGGVNSKSWKNLAEVKLAALVLGTGTTIDACSNTSVTYHQWTPKKHTMLQRQK